MGRGSVIGWGGGGEAMGWSPSVAGRVHAIGGGAGLGIGGAGRGERQETIHYSLDYMIQGMIRHKIQGAIHATIGYMIQGVIGGMIRYRIRYMCQMIQ